MPWTSVPYILARMEHNQGVVGSTESCAQKAQTYSADWASVSDVTWVSKRTAIFILETQKMLPYSV
jgi:hypothetical protein